MIELFNKVVRICDINKRRYYTDIVIVWPSFNNKYALLLFLINLYLDVANVIGSLLQL